MQWSQIKKKKLKVKRAIVFDCMKNLNYVNGILLLITHTIDMHHHKLGKSIFYFVAGPYLKGVIMCHRVSCDTPLQGVRGCVMGYLP